jgi:hypothetical protein
MKIITQRGASQFVPFSNTDKVRLVRLGTHKENMNNSLWIQLVSHGHYTVHLGTLNSSVLAAAVKDDQ